MNIWEKEKKEKITQINGHGNGGNTENPGEDTEDKNPVISAEGKIIISEAEWDASTHTASVTLNKVNGVNENLQVQYQINGTSEEKWVIGETATGIQHGQTIYARFWNGTKGGAYIEKKIIDGISPGVLVSITGTGTNTITATVEAGDNQSGLPSSPTYTFLIKEKGALDSTYKTEQSNSSTTCQFANLKQNTEYTIKVTVQDKAGNTGEATVDGRTETVVASTGNITFSLNPDSWTNGDVTVTANTTESITAEGYKIQVSKSTTFPETATEVKSVTVSSNQKVYARLIDSTNQANGYVETEVTKIDKTKPVITVATPTTNSVSITATDEASGIIGYKVTESDTTPTEFTSCTNTKSLSTTVSNLTQNKTYYAWVKDEAGNVSLSKEFKTTQVIASTGNITFEYNPTGWTNENVTVTGTSQVVGYKVQLSKDGIFPETAIEVKSVTVSRNQTIYARLVDSTNQSNGQATREVTKIDKDKPIITETIAGVDNIQIKATDTASGIVGYKVTTSNEEPTTFDECENTKELDTTVNGLNQGTTYYVWVKDEAGNISEASQNKTKKLVTSIELSETNITLQVGETKTIIATVNPSDADNKNVTWTSSDTSVATVENGTITAIESGETTITVTSIDENRITATCEVEVLGPKVELPSIAQSGTYIKYSVPEKEFTMSTSTTGYTVDQIYNTNEYTGLWKILYNDSEHGLQIISAEDVTEGKLLALGMASSKSSTGTTTNRAVYNNLVGILNGFCENYVNEDYATAGRCLGSNPSNPAGLNQYHSSSETSFIGSTIAGYKKGDEYCKIDLEALQNIETDGSDFVNKTPKEKCINKSVNTDEYMIWMAGRYSMISSTWHVFCPRWTTSYNNSNWSWMVYYGSGQGSNTYINRCGVRAIITLKPNIKTNKGNGSKEKPYELVLDN